MRKNINKYNLLRLLVAVIVFSLSVDNICAQDNSNAKNADRLIGTWTLDYNKSISQVKSKSRVYYDSLKQEKRDYIKTSFSNRKITFQEGGIYIFEVKPGVIKNGTWKLLKDQVTLVIKIDSGMELQQKIENISVSTMLLNLGDGQSKGGLFQKWHLKKLTN